VAWEDTLRVLDRAVLGASLGGAVLYSASGDAASPAVAVRGVFDEVDGTAYVLDSGVTMSGPRVFVRLEDLGSDPATDPDPIITQGGRRFSVREVRKDGQGGALLVLRERE
jgi:hypothetical protein